MPTLSKDDKKRSWRNCKLKKTWNHSHEGVNEKDSNSNKGTYCHFATHVR